MNPDEIIENQEEEIEQSMDDINGHTNNLLSPNQFNKGLQNQYTNEF